MLGMCNSRTLKIDGPDMKMTDIKLEDMKLEDKKLEDKK